MTSSFNCCVQMRLDLGNDSLFNSRSASLRYRLPYSSTVVATSHGRTNEIATTANRRNTALKEAMTKTQLLDALSESTGLQITFLRCTAGRSDGRKLSSVMALSWPRHKCAGQ